MVSETSLPFFVYELSSQCYVETIHNSNSCVAKSLNYSLLSNSEFLADLVLTNYKFTEGDKVSANDEDKINDED